MFFLIIVANAADYARMKRSHSFKCSNCNLQDIENCKPADAVPSTSLSTTDVVKPSNRPATLILPRHQSTPLIPTPPLIISPISPLCSPIFVPPRIISPLISPLFDATVENYILVALQCNPAIANAVNFDSSSEQQDSTKLGTSSER